MRFFYSRTILENHTGGGHENRQYIAVPVKVFKVITTIAERPNVNHFERAILSMCINGYLSPKTISEYLLIEHDLARFIVSDLKEKDLLDGEDGTTSKGKELLAGSGTNLECKPFYIFFDINSNSLLDEVVDVSSLKTQDAFVSERERSGAPKTLTISDEVSSIGVKLNILELSKGNDTNDSKLRERVKKECNGLDFGGVLRTTDLLDEEDEGFLITYIESGEEMNSLSRWSVASPFHKYQECEQIKTFLFENYSSKIVSSLINEALLGIKDKKQFDIMSGLRDTIQERLFSRPIPEEYGLVIVPLSHIVSPLSLDNKLDREIQKREYERKIALNFIELVEDVFFLKSFEDGFDINGVQLDKSKESNACLLTNLAAGLGFVCNDDVGRLLSVSCRDVEIAKKKSSGRVIGPVSALAILGCQTSENSYLMRMSSKYPGLFIELYFIKRMFRDKARHSVNNIPVDVEYYREMALYLVKTAFGLSVNQKTLDSIRPRHDGLDYSLSREVVRSYFGNDFDQSNERKITDIRMILISAYENYYSKKPEYLSNVRAVVEDTFTGLLAKELKNNPMPLKKDFHLQDAFESGYEMFTFLGKHKLNIEPLLIDQGDTRYPFRYGNDLKKEEDLVLGALTGGIRNANFSVKLKCFALLMRLSAKFRNKIEKALESDGSQSVKELLSLVTAVMFADRSHSQNTEFRQDYADTLIEKTFQILSDLYKYTDLFDWR